MAGKEARRTTSIARRINRSWLTRLLAVMLTIDLCVLLLSVCGWCYLTERRTLGSDWQPWLARKLEADEGLAYPQIFDEMRYVFHAEGGAAHTASDPEYFALVRQLFGILLMIEAFTLLGQYSSGKRRARKLLKPLQKIAETARELSDVRFEPPREYPAEPSVRIDEEKFHTLESAIESITAPGARLHTGDRDLQGLEAAVNNLLERMHAAYREQARFVSDASHELRTPIAVIQGYANMLDRWGKDDPKILAESISAIKAEAEGMQKLVEQLLFLARGDSGRNQIGMSVFSLSALMREVYEEYEMIDSRHIWRVETEGTVDVYGDAALLKQTARILCDNAAKYTPDGGAILLRARLTGRSVPCMQIQDEGVGIAAQDVSHIFERFFRSDRARARQTGGTGLGLSIAKWIVDQHQGYFEVLSREGLGTRISVFLPLRPPAPDEAH